MKFRIWLARKKIKLTEYLIKRYKKTLDNAKEGIIREGLLLKILKKELEVQLLLEGDIDEIRSVIKKTK